MNRIRFFPLVSLILSVVFCLDFGSQAVAIEESLTIKIGVLARRGQAACLQEWSPTARYLTENIPGAAFEIIPLNFQEITPAVKNARVDFVISNPYIYVELQKLYGVSRMVTMKRLTPQGHTGLFGGVIFCRANRQDIASLADLKGKSFAAVEETSFGGWIAAWREFKAFGINPARDFSTLKFGGTHDDVVKAVLDGEIDAGTVAAPILEQMAAEGRIKSDSFKILNATKTVDFPYAHSTRLYPEWPFARLRHSRDDIAEKVAVQLLGMPLQSQAAKASRSAGWTVPFDYAEVEACLKELQIGIYKDYGRITLRQLRTDYLWHSLSVIAIMTLLSGLLLYSLGLNRRLRASESSLQNEMQGHRQTNEELARSNESLRQSQQQLTDIIDFLPDATFVINNDGEVIAWNKAIEEMTRVSKENMLGQGDYAYAVPFYNERRKLLINYLDTDEKELAKAYLNVDRKESTVYAETFAPALYGGKGAYVWATGAPLLDAHGRRAGAIESIRDISDQKQSEAERDRLKSQLLQAQKMEAIGTLAGGIAHDFNNILGALLGYAEMAKEDSPVDSSIASDIEQVIKAGLRAKELVKQILAFSRQDKAERVPLQPATIIREAIKLLRPSLPSTIEIRQDVDPAAGPVLADPIQLHQVLVNLCTNASHAMEETGGILTIALKMTDLSREDLGREPQIQPGGFVQLSISDTGRGMSAELQARIFDPYFTTKEQGKGTGMGLAIVHGIVMSYGGYISCHSEPEKGTVFHIFLPTAACDPTTETTTSEAIPVGHEHILFIDDEEILAEMARTMLERLGYTVTVKNSGLNALATFQNQPDQFDLVITDQTMPGMTGAQLARRLLHIRPDLPVILCTGFSNLVSKEEADAIGIREFALKPMTRRDIAGLIRKVLDSGEAVI